MTTMWLLDTMPMSTVGRISVSMILSCYGVILQCWMSSYLSVSVMLSEILTLLHDSPAVASNLASGTTLGGGGLI